MIQNFLTPPPPLLLCVQQGAHGLPKTSPGKQHWYGSEEFLALPAQLHETELLALKLESLAQSVPLVNPEPPPPPRHTCLSV